MCLGRSSQEHDRIGLSYMVMGNDEVILLSGAAPGPRGIVANFCAPCELRLLFLAGEIEEHA